MSERRPLDQYQTAPWQVDALVDHLPELNGGMVWCPCVGDGSIIKQLKVRYPRYEPGWNFITNDIDPTVEASDHLDAAIAESWSYWHRTYGPPDWVVENPPFNKEHEIAALALQYATKGVVLMSRISFPEPTHDRGPWLAEHPRQAQIALERYSFTQNGKSDNATTEWLVWSKIALSMPGGHSAYGYKPRKAKAA